MGTNLFSTLISTIKSKITPLVTKFKNWTSWSFIRTKLISSIRDFFSKILDIRPRHKKDYYEVFGWLVSRRLALALVIVAGVLSVYYLFCVRSVLPSSGSDTVKTYSYDSLLLRFTSGTVQITAKSGYLAYEGEVASGAVTGYGTLYNAEGVVVYQGNFENNEYQGTGTRYYDDGTMMYTGEFEANAFSGTGKLYRENGTMEYEGDFALGMKDGSGQLYDISGNLVYEGNFSKDSIVYSEILGQKASEVAESYSGSRTVYEQDDSYAVVLDDIDVVYADNGESAALDEEITIGQVIVLSNEFSTGSTKLSTREELENYFGAELLIRTEELTLAEAVAFARVDSEDTELVLSQEYDDYYTVEEYGGSARAFTGTRDGLSYTFVSSGTDGTFSFYIIQYQE
ncbi:MAG: hypothetical protein LIO86_04180 [Lachnospiraceae bacterium]|nr:hypothetical protein [Lachnospiraceae bacterium]